MTLDRFMRGAYITLVVWAMVATVNGFGVDMSWWGRGATMPLRIVGWLIVLTVLWGEVACVWRDQKKTRG